MLRVEGLGSLPMDGKGRQGFDCVERVPTLGVPSALRGVFHATPLEVCMLYASRTLGTLDAGPAVSRCVCGL